MRRTLLIAIAAIGGVYFFSPTHGPRRRKALVEKLGRLRDQWPKRIEGSPAIHALASSSHVDITTTTEIRAPIEHVFGFFTHPENYLWLSDTVTDVTDLGAGRFAKDMLIGGMPVHFEERFTTIEPHVLIETRSLPRSAIQYMKSMWFEQTSPRRTSVVLNFAYQPPAGLVGHRAAEAMGVDPKTILEELMMAAKRHLESRHRKPQSDEAAQVDDLDEATFQPRSQDADLDDDSITGAMEQTMSPDEIDQAFTADRELAGHDTRDLLGDSMAAQTDEDGQNFVEEIQTAVTESPAPEEMEAAQVDPPSLEPDAESAIPRRKPR